VKKVTTYGLGVLLTMTGLSSAAEAPKTPAAKMKPALLVIDVQNAFLPYMSDQDTRLAPEMINYVIAQFREHGYPVIRIYHTGLGSGPKPDTEPFEFAKSIAIQPDDPKIVKNYPNAFKKTGLESLLREKGVNTLFLVGLSSTGCVLATYHGALDRDFDAFLVQGALIGPESDLTHAVERMSETVGYEALRVMLENAAK
jgi:nicotinamidase-related amidase